MLIDLLRSAVDSTQGITFGQERESYAQLHDRAIALARGLVSIGLGDGARVGILLPNSRDLVVSLAAVTGAGAVAVPLNPLYGQEELSFYADKADLRAFITTDAGVAVCRRAMESVGLNLPVVAASRTSGADHERDELSRAGSSIALPATDPAALSILLHSSGTTGRPKLIPRTGAQLAAEADSYVATVKVGDGDVMLCTVPLFHSYGLGTCLLAGMRAQASLIVPLQLNPLPRYLPAIAAQVEDQKVTIWPGVPILYDLLAELSRPADLSSLRLCLSAGTPLAGDVFDRFAARFGVSIRQQYGCSEMGALTINLADDVAATRDSVGAPLAGIELEIDPTDNPAAGEVVVRGSTLADGYLGDEAANRVSFTAGGFRTADLGRLDAAGNLYLTGRRRMFVEIAGNKVDPYEVEDLLVQYPGVVEAVVVGTTVDGRRHQTLKAVIVADRELDPQAIRRFCRERCAPFKVPELVEFRDEIPRSPLGKILRKHLI